MATNPIQWFPGHMAKTRRMMQECLPQVDLVLELLDARIPYSSRNPDIGRLLAGKPKVCVLTKSTLADPNMNQVWIKALAEEGIVPTSMIDISDGLASEVLQICKASKCGARIYLDRIPIAKQTTALAEQMHIDPVVAALNGGNDYELLFTVPLAMQEKVMGLGLVDIVGHITRESTGAYLVTPDGSDIRLRAQGFKE